MTLFSKFTRIAAPLAFAALFGLAACSKEQTPQEQPENIIEEPNVQDIPPEATPTVPETLNETPPANVAVATPVDRTSQDQQMQEDADAAGMTSKMPSPDQTAAANDGEKTK